MAKRFKVSTWFEGDPEPYVLRTNDLEAAIADLRGSLDPYEYSGVVKVTLKTRQLAG